MKKSKEAKYEEAVERGLRSLVVTSRRIDWSQSLSELRHKVGIKQNDTSYDERLRSIQEAALLRKG